MKPIIFSCCLMALFSHSALALNLQQAKQQGLVGEANNGFIAIVNANHRADVSQLIKTVNNHRQNTYNTISQSHDLSLIDVKQRAYFKAVEKTQRGNYYQDSDGTWRKK
ncbi:YdbL family protein [Photobacterium aquimaris]|uniref:DUF1318 domain-containing protein n=1 Tax=Photobacterium aquimaris TaxID=512643 RepID=A0A2T3HU98_9GAMM|nr:YdbL family protein [Photobacterium aquimaris]MCP4954158.1 YdbL family protein [Photobacterium aquimaris]OBU23716.1 hypothetical protein AYY21_12725 [Photobacterium aquimaris]PQJ38675.1 hypothetical protein BTN98_14875 [Photobacterium aquimaris]PSU00141.1 DUF1318 domain-containing protein [Photobacterium aquimaris]